MNKSTLFKSAHKLTKSVIQFGDSYRVTFGICLKSIYAQFSRNVITVNYDSISQIFSKMGAQCGTAKNKSRYIECVIGGEMYNHLINGGEIFIEYFKRNGTLEGTETRKMINVGDEFISATLDHQKVVRIYVECKLTQLN